MAEEDLNTHLKELGWGLNLDRPEVSTQEEIDTFRRVADFVFGKQQDGLDYWLDEKPEVLKRYRAWAGAMYIPRAAGQPANTWAASGVVALYRYANTGFDPGLAYGIHVRTRNMTKAQILEEVELVFRYCGPRGMEALARALRAQTFPEAPSNPVTWPAGWAPDPDAFRSGVDFSSREATPEDVRKIVDWYDRTLGEVPRHIRFLARHRPDVLKTYRSRYENTLRLLPKQTEPWALLQISMLNRDAGRIREAMLLARAWGITKPQVLEAISWGTFYANQGTLDLVDEVAGDIVDAWPS
jgi:hypothetical protein